MSAFNINAFMTQQDQLKQINIELLVPYHNHKFKLYTGERLEDMINSIKEKWRSDTDHCPSCPK